MFDIEHAHNAYDPKTVWDKRLELFIVRHYHDGEFGSPEWFNKENIINELGFVDAGVVAGGTQSGSGR